MVQYKTLSLNQCTCIHVIYSDCTMDTDLMSDSHVFMQQLMLCNNMIHDKYDNEYT